MQAKDVPEGGKAEGGEVQLKSIRKAYLYCFIMCISTVYFGYSITLISATATSALIDYYEVELPQQAMISLLNGILPVGAMLTCLLIPCALPLTNKKQIHYILLPITVIQCGLSVIHSLEALLVARFLLGVLNAFYISVAAMYLKETFPSSLRNRFGAIYTVGRVLGIVVCFSIAEAFDYREDNVEHISVYFGLSYIALVQAVLLYFFIPHSPKEMIAKNNELELWASVETLYGKENVQRAMAQIRAEVEAAAEANRTACLHATKLTSRKNMLSMHLALLRQFCGVTFIVVYSRQVAISLGFKLANLTPLIINSIQLASNIIGVFLVGRLNKQRMLIFGTVTLAAFNLAIGITDLLEQAIPCIACMAAFMVPCGTCLTSVIWSYPSQLASPTRGKYASMVSWGGMAVVTLVPPYVMRAMPDRSAYPIFFFFALYMVFAAVVNRLVLVEMRHLEVKSAESKMTEMLVV